MKKAFLFVLFGIIFSFFSLSNTASAAFVVENYSTKASDTWIDFEIEITKGYTAGVNVSCTDPSKKTTYATASKAKDSNTEFVARCTSLTPETTYTYAIYASDAVSFPTRNDSTKTLSKSDLVVKPEIYKLEQKTGVTPENGKYTTSSKVSITNPIELVGYRLALGKPESSNGTTKCTFLPDFRAEQRADKASVENKFLIINGSWSLNEGTYCLGIEKETGVSTRVFTTAIEVLEIIIVGGKTIPTGTPNENGCIENGTDEYCAMALLPGIGEVDAQGKSTGKISLSRCFVDGVEIQGQPGFGCYLNNILRLVMGIIIIISIIVIIASGIEAMTSQNGEKKVTWKGRMRGAILGLVLALSSYLILNTLNNKLVNLGVTLPSPTLIYAEDISGAIPTNELIKVNPDPNIRIPSGDAQSLAMMALRTPSLRFNANNVVRRDNDAQSAPLQNIKDTAEGRPAWTSSITGRTAVQVPLDAKMLAGLIAVSQVDPMVGITAILGGEHDSKSVHYLGKAFDIQTDQSDSPSSLPRAKKLGDACRAAGAKLIITPCGGNYVKDFINVTEKGICTATGYSTNKSHSTHVHCQW